MKYLIKLGVMQTYHAIVLEVRKLPKPAQRGNVQKMAEILNEQYNNMGWLCVSTEREHTAEACTNTIGRQKGDVNL